MKPNTRSHSKKSRSNVVTGERKAVHKRFAVAITLLLGSCIAISLAVTANPWRLPATPTATVKEAIVSAPALQSTARGRLHSKLSLQPAADRMRRRLGYRFSQKGREVMIAVGALILNGSPQAVQIRRSQGDDGENVSVVLSGQATLTWSSTEGVKSQGQMATGSEREIIERLVFDSPEQFILAQVRGNAYALLASSVRPAEAGDAEDYKGPVWEVVQVTEGDLQATGKPLQLTRLYLINSTTGLLDKVITKEQEQTITAELSGWVEENGERLPTRVVWRRNNQMLMELHLTTITFLSGQ